MHHIRGLTVVLGLLAAFSLPVPQAAAQVFLYGAAAEEHEKRMNPPEAAEQPAAEATPAEEPETEEAAPVAEATQAVAAEERDVSRDRVVLLHGMGHGPRTMADIAKNFEVMGYKVSNLNLKLERDTLHVIIDEAYKDISRYAERDGDRINFVCYSQGCLVARGIIEQHRPQYLGRVVMLGPPNQGGEMIDWLRQRQISTFLTEARYVPNLGTANKRNLAKLIGVSADGYELGIIAGQEPNSTLPIHITVPGANRSKLGPHRTLLDGMKEFATVQANHDDMYKDKAVEELTVQFIHTGSFEKHDPAPQPTE